MILLLRPLTGQPQLLHDSLDSFMVYTKTTLQKLLVYSSYTISSFVFMENRSDFRGYTRISLLHFICLSNLIVICWL